MKTKFKRKEGQAMVEYIIIVAVVAVAALVIFGLFGDTIQEKLGGAILELDRTPNPLRDELFEVPVMIDNATANVPTGSGLGVVVDRAALESFRVKKTEIR